MGEIIIKVPGDIKEVFAVEDKDLDIRDFKKKVNRIIKRLENLLFLTYYYPKLKHSIEVEEVTEEEMYLQED